MEVVIRADSSLTIGSGHVMRCLTLAQALREQGAEVRFVCRGDTGHLCGQIGAAGFSVERLPVGAGGTEDKDPTPSCRHGLPAGSGGLPAPSHLGVEAGTNAVGGSPAADLPAHTAWLGVTWQKDAAETCEALTDWAPVDWLVVDHYALDARWEAEMRSVARRIMVIDDLADRRHECDLLLDQNYYLDLETRYDRLVPEECRKLLGPRYALLRPEFAEARKNLRKRDGIVRRVLVFFGGMDPTNETAKAIRAILDLNRPGIAVDVVVGGSNPHRSQIQRLCESHPGLHFHCQISGMAELMVRADLAIGGGGASTWERCALALPSIVLTLAENQEGTIQHLAEVGAVVNLGKRARIKASDITAAVLRLLTSTVHTLDLSRHAAAVMSDADRPVIDFLLEDCYVARK